MFTMKVRKFWNGDRVRERLLVEHKAGLLRLADFVTDSARRYCPVDTGQLRDSIQRISEADGLRHHVIASASHAEPVEFGHRKRNGAFHPANPFLRRALDDGARALPSFVGGSRVRQGYHQGRLMGATFGE